MIDPKMTNDKAVVGAVQALIAAGLGAVGIGVMPSPETIEGAVATLGAWGALGLLAYAGVFYARNKEK